MKLIQTIKGYMPVPRKALDQSEMDKAWLLTQLRQASATNVRLERALAHATPKIKE